MNIDEFSLALANALRGAMAGDNSQILVIEQMKENPIQYCHALLQIIKSDESLRTIVLIELKNIINSNYESFPPDFNQLLCQEYIQIYQFITDPKQLRIIASTFIKLYDVFGPNWTDFPSVFTPNPEKLFFQIELLSELLLKLNKNAEFIISSMEIFLNLALVGLQQDDWNLKLKSIGIVLQMAVLDPEAVTPHVNIILALIQKSPDLPEMYFLGLWIEFASFIEVYELQQGQLQIIYEAATRSLQTDHLSADSKVQALSALSLLPFTSEQSTIEILTHAFNLALIKVQMGEFIDSVPDLFLKAIDDYGSQLIYNFLKDRIVQSMGANTSVPETISVSLYIIKWLIEKIETEVRNDWPLFNQLIDCASKTKPDENPILLVSCMMFIASLNSNFEMQLLESHLFADFTIPLIVSPSPEIRQHARDAIYKAIDSISVPLAGIADKIWSINSAVTVDVDQYLTLLAKAIEQEGDQFETEKALQMSQFLLECFNGNNELMIIGALSVATTLILTNEAVHEILLLPTINTIHRCLDSEVIEVQINGLKRMSSLFPSFKEHFAPESVQKVEKMIQDENPLVIENAATCFYVIAKEMNQKMIIGNIIPTFQQWIIAQNKVYFTVAVTAVQSLAPILDLAKTAEVVNNICGVAMKTNDEEIVSDCFEAVGAILSKTVDISARPKIAEMASSFALAFMRGEFEISNQSPPLDCNFKLSTIMSFARLLCDMLHFEFELNEFIFLFTQSLIKTGNTDYIDIALSIIGDGVLYNGFNQPQQKAFIISYIKSLSVPHTNIILIHSISYVLLCLIEKGAINAHICNNFLPTIIEWWNNLYNSMKEIMLPTLSNLSILIWTISLKYGQLIPNVFAQSFELFPPKDNDDTLKMCEMLIQIANNQQLREAFSIQIAFAISKLLVLPKMMIIKKGITNDIIMNLAVLLSDFFKSDPNIQETVLRLYEKSQISQNRIMSFIQ